MDRIALIFAALADRTRLRLLHLMSGGEICVCHLQGVLQSNQPKVSRHLAYLRKAGLVSARREGKWMHYRIKQQAPDIQRFFSRALDMVAKQPLARKDATRLKNLGCCPPQTRLPNPQA